MKIAHLNSVQSIGKRIFVSFLFLISFLSCKCEDVDINSSREPDYCKHIRDAVSQIKVVDTHEHLMSPGILGGHGVKSPDFSLLFYFYTSSDLRSAGMSGVDFDKFMGNSMSVIEKWQLVEPYWNATKNTAFSRGVILAADKLYGITTIDISTVETLSDKIRVAYQDPKSWYNEVLKTKCGIEYIIEDRWDWDYRDFYDPNTFRFVNRFDDFLSIMSNSDLNNFTKWKSSGIKTLSDLEEALGVAFQAGMNDGMVAVKSAQAYSRTLFYDNTTEEKAKEVFAKIKTSSTNLSSAEAKPLADYMMHRVLDLARKYKMPVQFHTGLQGDNGNIIENSKPTNLVNLIREYPDVKFILFHGSYPYGGELSTMAKNFPNVYIDMCWLYMISPSYSERYLHEWLETVPANKIMAFGGDFSNIEGVYSHLLMAKQVITNVLIAKVKDGYFTENEAIKIAKMILHDNAVRILNLK